MRLQVIQKMHNFSFSIIIENRGGFLYWEVSGISNAFCIIWSDNVYFYLSEINYILIRLSGRPITFDLLLIFLPIFVSPICFTNRVLGYPINTAMHQINVKAWGCYFFYIFLRFYHFIITANKAKYLTVNGAFQYFTWINFTNLSFRKCLKIDRLDPNLYPIFFFGFCMFIWKWERD